MGMCSPFQGRVTSNHHTGGGYPGHKGTDIAPPKPGQTGKPVYAAFDGTIRKIYRKSAHGNRNSTWAPGRTGNGMLVSNPDGEGNGYNHMRPLGGLEVGDKVSEGQLIGYNDRSGNQSGPHLHFELWSNWQNPNSDYDAQDAFHKFKVTAGSAPKVNSAVKAPKAPVKPSKNPEKNDKGDYIAIAKALNAMGIDAGYPDGANGPKLKGGIKAFQRQHNLVDDGVWGNITQEVYEYNKRLQNALNVMKSDTPKLKEDGWLGSPSLRRRDDVLKRNGWSKKNLIASLKKVGAW